MQQFLDQGMIGKWEQKVIEYAIRKSYSNITTIKDIYKNVFGIKIVDIEDKMRTHFWKRHLLAHKNGRLKDNSYLEVTQEKLDDLISDSRCFVNQIMAKFQEKGIEW